MKKTEKGGQKGRNIATCLDWRAWSLSREVTGVQFLKVPVLAAEVRVGTPLQEEIMDFTQSSSSLSDTLFEGQLDTSNCLCTDHFKNSGLGLIIIALST